MLDTTMRKQTQITKLIHHLTYKFVFICFSATTTFVPSIHEMTPNLLFKVWKISKNIMYMHIILSWSYLLFQFDIAEYSSYLTNTMNAISLCLTYQLVYVIYTYWYNNSIDVVISWFFKWQQERSVFII